MSNSEFCFRACKEGPNAPALCQHVYDVLGCMWNMPGDYSSGVFERCEGDTGEPMGVYGTSTFSQGEPVTPDAHPAPATSQCTTLSTIGNGVAVAAMTTAGNASLTGTLTTTVSYFSHPSVQRIVSCEVSSSAGLVLDSLLHRCVSSLSLTHKYSVHITFLYPTSVLIALCFGSLKLSVNAGHGFQIHGHNCNILGIDL